MTDRDHKKKVSVDHVALLFVALTLRDYRDFLSELRDAIREMHPGDQLLDEYTEVEVLLFVMYAYDLVIQQGGNLGFGTLGKSISRRFRDAMVLFNEMTNTCHVESSAWFERAIEDRFEEYYVAMSRSNPTGDSLINVGGAFPRFVCEGGADAFVAALGALRLAGILRFTPSIGQHLVVDPGIGAIPRSAVVSTVRSLMRLVSEQD